MTFPRRLLSGLMFFALLATFGPGNGVGPSFAVSTARAQTADKGTGLPLPRFVSLRSDQVNLRTGPGVRYPVEWVYVQRDLPMEIIAEFDTWRKVRDWQGTEGWMHQSMLSGRRTLITTNTAPEAIRPEPTAEARPLAWLEPEVIGRLKSCPDGMTWCRVEVKGYQGWLDRNAFWGAYPRERVE